jgi:hypothetical protein
MADDPAYASGLIKDVNAVVQTTAILVGGIWAYLKFVKGRTFRPRLEPTVSAKTSTRGDYIDIIVSGALKNVGGSRVDIKQQGTGLRVLTAKPETPNTIMSSDWQHQGSFEIFDNHDWIEPGETICDQRLIAIRNDNWTAIKLEVQVQSEKVVWHAMAIVEIN